MIATIKFVSNKMLSLIVTNFKIEKNCNFFVAKFIIYSRVDKFSIFREKNRKSIGKKNDIFRENSDPPEGEILLWLN